MIWEGNGTALNICELNVDHVMPEKFIEFFRNYQGILQQYNKKVSIQTIDKDGDF